MTEGWGCPEVAKRRKNAAQAAGSRSSRSQTMPEVTDLQNARFLLKETGHSAHERTVLGRAIEYAEALERAGLNPVNINGEDLYEFLTDERVRTTFVNSFPQPSL
ncbi:MAG: hypothetical protein GY778_03070 [bacterium]|nr:hypothetical protein [bacterium]